MTLWIGGDGFEAYTSPPYEGREWASVTGFQPTLLVEDELFHLNLENLGDLMGGHVHHTSAATFDIETDSFDWDGPTTTIVTTSNTRDERYCNMNRAQRRKIQAQERRAFRRQK